MSKTKKLTAIITKNDLVNTAKKPKQKLPKKINARSLDSEIYDYESSLLTDDEFIFNVSLVHTKDSFYEL